MESQSWLKRFLLGLLFFHAAAVFANAAFERVDLQNTEKKIQAFAVRESKPSSTKWQVLLPSTVGYPTEGKTVQELTEKTKTSVAVNGNFYREDKDSLQEPIGLVVHHGLLFSEPRTNWPSIGYWNHTWNGDQVTLESQVEIFSEKSKIISFKLCRLNASATLGCAVLWTNLKNSKRFKKTNLRKLFLAASGSAPQLGESELSVANATEKSVWVLELPQNISPKLLKDVSKVKLHLKLKGKRFGDQWNTAEEAISGSHFFSATETLPAPSLGGERPWAEQQQPRTVVGQDDQKRIFVAVFDGRRVESPGVSVKAA